MKMPWNRQPQPERNPSGELERRVADLEAALSGMTASVGLMRVEWAEVLDKINRWAARQSGRLGKQAKENLDAAAQETAGDTISGAATSGGQRFTKADLRRLANARRQPNGAHQ